MNRKKLALLFLVGFIGLVSAAAASSYMIVTMAVTRFGPFYNSQVAFDSLNGGQPGGEVRTAIVGGTTDTLRIGDVVYWSDTNKVTKSTTRALYNAIAGVVVGGASTSDRTSIVAADVGTVAATTGKRVIILKQGRTWMKSDANAAIIAGRRLLPSDSIAGRFDTSLTATVIDSFYRMIGRNVNAGSALGTVLVDVNIK
jgi:predicted DCC family thiol-disulfide oxidoreductase YuxK